MSFDIFPEGHKTLLLMPAKLTVVEHGTDEPTESDRAREKRLVICMHFFIFFFMHALVTKLAYIFTQKKTYVVMQILFTHWRAFFAPA